MSRYPRETLEYMITMIENDLQGYGKSYFAILREPNTNIVLGLKPLDPASMFPIVNNRGRLTRYVYRPFKGAKPESLEPSDVLSFD